LVNKLGERCVIIRIPEIWGKDCPRISKLIEDTQNNIPVVTYPNLYVNYTTNIQIAEWIHYIIVENLTGIFHVGTKDTYDYMNFQSQLCTILDLKKPTFKGETAMQRLYQAVLPGRREIPEKWQMKVTDVLRFLGRVQKRKSPL
jgi:dTDP-4-dehydrorhamnose reductase